MESICTHTLIGSNTINTECSILARFRRTFVCIYNGSGKLSDMHKNRFYYILCLSNTNNLSEIHYIVTQTTHKTNFHLFNRRFCKLLLFTISKPDTTLLGPPLKTFIWKFRLWVSRPGREGICFFSNLKFNLFKNWQKKNGI